MKTPQPSAQADVARWFDYTYKAKGKAYLRPFDAYPIFLQLLGVEEEKDLLDVACGAGFLLQAARLRKMRPFGIDLSFNGLTLATEELPDTPLVKGNSESIPFANESFDYVTCLGSIERFFDREAALREMRRVARPKARFCFMVRNIDALGWKIWRQGLRQQNHQGHQDALSRERWEALFVSLGFKVENVYMDQWFRQKVRKAFRGFRSHDFSNPEPVAEPWLSLRFAYEFIFILSH